MTATRYLILIYLLISFPPYSHKIGMRLAMRDVLHSVELKAMTHSPTRLSDTLDRIIACENTVRSKHVLPIIKVV